MYKFVDEFVVFIAALYNRCCYKHGRTSCPRQESLGILRQSMALHIHCSVDCKRFPFVRTSAEYRPLYECVYACPLYEGVLMSVCLR